MTLHAWERIDERINLRGSAAIKFVDCALERGRRAKDFKNRERAYLQEKEYNGVFTVCYSGYCLIFDEYETCITVYLLPKWFERKNAYCGKQYIRHPKKYMKYMPSAA